MDESQSMWDVGAAYDPVGYFTAKCLSPKLGKAEPVTEVLVL